jgi:hypothetical protein
MKEALSTYKLMGFIVILAPQVIKSLSFFVFVHFSNLNETFGLQVETLVTVYWGLTVKLTQI